MINFAKLRALWPPSLKSGIKVSPIHRTRLKLAASMLCFHGTAGRGTAALAVMFSGVESKPSARAVKAIVPGSLPAWTITSASPLKTLRFHCPVM